MKKQFLLLSVFLLSNISYSGAQTYTTDVPYHMAFDSSYVVGQAVVDSFDISKHQGYVSGQFVLCHNAIFTFKGNQSSSSPSFYLYPGSKLILEDSYFYPTIYMMPTSSLDAKGGNQNIICHREGTATLADTASVNWLKDSVYTNMSFTFSGWPNAISPCPVVAPQGVNDIQELEVNISIHNKNLNILLQDEQQTQLRLFDMQGKRLISRSINGYAHVSLAHLANGIYIVHVMQKGKLRRQKILLD